MPNTSLPLWAVYAVGFGAPIAAFVGGVVGQLVTRKGAKEMEKRSRREETMRNLRWASELAVEPDEHKAQLGVAQLKALGGSDMLDAAEQLFVDAALESVLGQPINEMREVGPTAGAYVPIESQSVNEPATSTVESSNGLDGGDDGEADPGDQSSA